MHAGSRVVEDELSQRLSGLARRLQAQTDTSSVLDAIVAAAVTLIPGVEDGSVSVVAGRRQDVTSHSPSGDLPRQVDALQGEVGQGPSLDAFFGQQTVRVPDMTDEQRWPRFTERAAELGTRSMLSLQLFVEHENLGALNLYSRHPYAFDDESERIGLLVASHAAVALAQAQKLDHLAVARDHRDRIGQAKGIVMERYGIDPAAAFALLVRLSQDTNHRLADVAEELVTTGQLTGLEQSGKDRSSANPRSPRR